MSDAPGSPSQTDDDEPKALPGEAESPHPSDTASQSEGEPLGAELAGRASSERPRKKARKSSKSRKAATASAREVPRSASRPASSGPRGALFVTIALASGLAAGWFLGASRAVADDADEVGPAASGSARPAAQCTTWSEQICAETGKESAACMQSKAAGELLPASACKAALKDVSATVERVRAARAVCDTLVSRLCKDLGETSPTCDMVKKKTESFSPDRCEQMIANYDQVVGELKMMAQRGMMPPGGKPPGGMPAQAMPPGASPR